MLTFGISLLLISSVIGSPVRTELSVCQDEYDAQMGKLIASAGISGAQGVWHLIFSYLDLNHDEVVTATEIAVRMEEERLIGDRDIMMIMREAEQWISSSDAAKGHFEVNKEQFELLIRTTLGIIEPTPSPKTKNIVENVCQLFVRMIPEIAWAMHDTKNCSDSIKKEEKPLLDLGTEQLALNTWFAVFSTIDTNKDNLIDIHEVKIALAVPLTEQIDQVLNLAFGSVMGSGNVTVDAFYNLVTDIVFGSKRKSIYLNATIPQLHGRQYFCHVLKKVNHDVIKQRTANFDCSRVYEGVADIVLGADHIYAPEILFTMADLDRDGAISQPEYESFAGELSPVYLSTTDNGMGVEYFTTLTPLHFKQITDLKHNLNETTVRRFTRMSLPEMIGEEQLCNGMIKALKTFPHRPQNEVPYPTRESLDQTPDQEEEEEKEFESEMEHYYPQNPEGLQVEEPTRNIEAPVEEFPTEPTEVLEEQTAPDEEVTTNGISIEDEVHEFVSNSYPEEEANQTTPEIDHFEGDLQILINNVNSEPNKSQEEMKLQALLEQMHGEENSLPPLMHMPEHENLLTEDEELELKMLLDGIFQSDSKLKKQSSIPE